MKKYLIIILLAVLGLPKLAIAQFTLGAEIRPRAEFRNGFKAPRASGVDPAFFIEQRSRIYFDYKTEKLVLKVSLQDVRIWGSVSQIYKTDPNMQNVYEAWGQYNFNEKFAMRIGRVALDYDNARFLGNLGWAAQGRSHDAFLLLYNNESGVKLDVGLAYNQNWRFEPAWLNGNFYNHSTTNNYKSMQFVHFSKKWENANMSALFHNDGRQVAADSSMAFRQTYALLGSMKLNTLTVGAEFYYQGGKNGGGTDVSAVLASAYVTLKTNITPLTLGFDYLTGTNPADTKDKSFNPLYGTNHKFYGFMDYFYVGNGHSSKGLVDIFLKANFKLGEKSNLISHIHYFASPANIDDPANPGTNLSGSLGTEIDVVYVATLHKAVKLNIGYSQMFASDSMIEVKGGSGDTSVMNNWIWAMITFKPTLFKSKEE